MNAPLHAALPADRPVPGRRLPWWALVPVVLLAGHVTLMVVATSLATGKNGPVLDPAYRQENKVTVGDRAAKPTAEAVK